MEALNNKAQKREKREKKDKCSEAPLGVA